MDSPGQLQSAKTHFSELVDAALEGPQHARSGAPGFIEYLLAVPKPKSSRRLRHAPVVSGPRLRDIDFE